MDHEDRWNTYLNDLEDGKLSWPDHEWIRTGNPTFGSKYQPTPSYDLPIWQGERTRLLVNSDFGMGDTIHFYRFIPDLIQRNHKVFLRCDSDFRSLFPEVDVIGKDDPIPDADHIIHMMCLPKYVKSKHVPYVTPVGEAPVFCEKISSIPNSVGFCYASHPFAPNRKERSIPNHLVESLKGRYFHLVKHEKPPNHSLDCRGLMSDWNATAHLLNSLTTITTVDTAIAHLAGAMGKPTLLLASKYLDWRWKLLADWYPSVRVIQGDTWENTLRMANIY